MTPVKTKMDKAVEALFQCLPASSYDEIRRKMQRETGWRINVGFVRQVLSHVRHNVPTYGFTIPYVMSGGGKGRTKAEKQQDTEDRYFAILVQRDGTFHMDPQHRRFFSDGIGNKIMGVGTVVMSASLMIEVSLQYERSAIQRDFWEDQLETLNYVGKRIARMNKAIKEKAA